MEKNEVHFDQEEVVKEKLEEIRKAASRIVDFLFPSATEQEKHIREGADQEARLESITLDSHGLTPGMRDFCLCPAQRTLETFNTILHDFQAKISPYKEKMTALENFKNIIEELENKANSLEVQAEKEVGSDHKYKEAKEDYGKYYQQYDTMYCQKGQMHAKDFPLWLYFPLLFGIGLVEAAMNYFAILEQYGLPAFAAGITIVLGASVAYASHEHGTLLKQREYYFGGTVERRQKKTELFRVGMAAFALLLSLGFVGWNRYLWVMAELSRVTQSSIDIGGSGVAQEVNVGQSVLMTMIANILVYLIGAAIAFWVHDKDPDYTTRKRELNKATVRWNEWQEKVEEMKKVIRKRLTKEMAEQRNLCEALAKRYKPLFDEHEKVVEKEKKIRHEADVFFNSLVNEYKNRFESNAKAMNQGISIIHNGNMLTVADYAGLRFAEDYFSVLASR